MPPLRRDYFLQIQEKREISHKHGETKRCSIARGNKKKRRKKEEKRLPFPNKRANEPLEILNMERDRWIFRLGPLDIDILRIKTSIEIR
jgi:hypothetical protein